MSKFVNYAALLIKKHADREIQKIDISKLNDGTKLVIMNIGQSHCIHQGD